MMNLLSRILVLGALVLLAAGCGSTKTSSIACTQALPLEFAYMLSSQGTAVSMFTVDSCTGTFTATTPATVSTGVGPGQMGAEDMVVDPLGRFVYVANLISNASDQATIAMFTINRATGVLTPTTPATVSTGFLPQGIAIDPAGKFVYTANTDDNTVSMFTVNATGVLSPTTPPAVAAGRGPGFLAVHPSGKFLYVANSIDDTVSMYTIDTTTGLLSPATPATVHAGADPFGVTIDPSGKFAYVVGNLSNSVSAFSIDPNTGVLTPTSTVAVGQGPTAIAIDPSGKFAYVVNRLDNTLSMLLVNPVTGALTLNVTATVATGTQPFRVLFDPARRFLYVVNEASAASVYTISGDGTLKSAGSTGGEALSMAIAAGTK